MLHTSLHRGGKSITIPLSLRGVPRPCATCGSCAADEVGHALLVCTFFVVLLTVLFNGGASPWMMRVLALRAEDEDRQAC